MATLALSFALADLAGSLAPLLDGPFLRQAAQVERGTCPRCSGSAGGSLPDWWPGPWAC
ncbi:MAG: hypothetical protein HZT43_16320 [Exiguobacterium profundum]|nr:MAG: hypothetical protein HZT43_16320 [Exiguobacterium profundum]